jgi:hypothetical protein
VLVLDNCDIKHRYDGREAIRECLSIDGLRSLVHCGETCEIGSRREVSYLILTQSKPFQSYLEHSSYRMHDVIGLGVQALLS